ncbi:heme exporter protein CcmD [Undibacterium sp. Ji22W]|uniref:heme exporter protein CcmD n=1 Tax=Undibacterium sp. Ji22W TaxID=3413038 RepID=UPI003BF3D4AD
MIWTSWEAFFAMGGYAIYVWSASAIVIATLLLEIVALNMQQAKQKKDALARCKHQRDTVNTVRNS